MDLKQLGSVQDDRIVFLPCSGKEAGYVDECDDRDVKSGVGAVGMVGAVNEGATKSGVMYPGSSTVSGSGAWVAFSAAGFAAGVSSVRIPCSMRWLMSRWAFSLSWLSSFSTFFSTR